MLGSTDVNLEQLRAGLAWLYRAYERKLSEEFRSSYASAEQEVGAAELVLWKGCEPVPPWVWRHRGPVNR